MAHTSTHPQSGSVNVTVRSATAADTEFARQVHHQAYREVVERQFGPWREAEQDQFFEADWRDARFEIILADGEPCGYVAIQHREDDLHVRELVILPACQGKGIGSRILQDVIAQARQRRVPVRLGTFHQNRAVALYRRLGFEEVGRTATHVLLEWRPF